MKIGDRIYVRGYVDEIRKDTVIVRNDGGYFGTVLSEVTGELPSAQPEHTNSCYTNSWCIDCKEYDTENKCCPRYNRVIKQTLDDAYRHGETEAEARFHDEIVRCKECKHGSPNGKYGCRVYHYRRYETHDMKPDDFCSHAKRKNGGAV